MVDWNGRTGYVDLSKSRYRESKSRWQKKNTENRIEDEDARSRGL